jgi:oligoribonuclease
MPQDPNALVWIDLEMTGLDPDTDRIIEIATIITDSDLNVLGVGPVLAVHQSDEYLDGMDEWNTRTHGKTGLTERVKASKITELIAENETLEFIREFCPRNKSPLCGNSICQDRRFLYRYMPQLESWLHAGIQKSTMALVKKIPTRHWMIYRSRLMNLNISGVHSSS